jgi:hypothetical protein
VGVHLPGKHPLELEQFHLVGQTVDVGLDFPDRPQIRFLGGEIQKVRRVAQGTLEPVQTPDDLLQLGALLPEFLGALRDVPNAGLLELPLYFLQPLVLVVVIKDTSSKSRCAPRDL